MLDRDAERRVALSSLAGDFAAVGNDARTLVALVARRVSEVFGELCVIHLRDEFAEPEQAGVTLHHPKPELLTVAHDIRSAFLRVCAGVVSRVAETGEAVLIPTLAPEALHAGFDAAERAAFERLGLKGLVVAPLSTNGRPRGVMLVAGSDPERPLHPLDLQLVEDVAARLGLMLAPALAAGEERPAHDALLGARRSLRESDEAHRLLFDTSPLPIFVFDTGTLSPLAVNRAALELYGYELDGFMRLNVVELAVNELEAARLRLVALGDSEASGVSRYRRRDGSEFAAEYTMRALDFAGRRARIAVIKDITARLEAEGMRALLAAIVESSNDAIVSKRLDGTITSFNAAAERLFGYTAAEAIGSSVTMLFPDDRVEEERELLGRLIAGEHVDHYETVRRHKNGSLLHVSLSLAPVLDTAGNVIGASKTVRDLTAQHLAAEALRRTEEQLRQAQKMEAVGRLAGGIAHDFNNVLSVVLGYSSLLLENLDASHPMTADVAEIRKAALHATDLTRQLLLFSRHQVAEPKVIDLNETLAGMAKILGRVLGEDIELTPLPGANLGRIRVDPSHADQVIMNLVVNARDAMPTGGRLTIETSNIELDAGYAREHLGSKAGPHVMLAVSDTGTGMDAATQSRIFEPFFTTKAAGKGTGLGLSTVFGIAQQCGGSVWVYSELGKGTTFKVYFPRVDAVADAPRAVHAPATLRGSETILLVEDQEQVRAVAADILERNGYRVLVAASAAEGLRLAAGHAGTIHLLLTDLVMPQMSGAELAKRLTSTRAELKVLCMSGYTDDSVVRHGVLDSRIAFLQKPFTPESLTRRIREVLEASDDR